MLGKRGRLYFLIVVFKLNYFITLVGDLRYTQEHQLGRENYLRFDITNNESNGYPQHSTPPTLYKLNITDLLPDLSQGSQYL